MSSQTYLFYDIESTGLNKCFDQVLQFAAIRTDLKLNEIDRHEIKIRLNPDVIPSPGAVITHRIGVSAAQSGEPELTAIKTIHDLLNTPGTISLGYNTLGFDDEFLRFSFHRNLLAPYTHQYANRCHRMDLYPITILYYLFKPEAINWPKQDNRPSFKLENLSAENHLAEGPAHDAMVDVEATLALAKKFMAHRDMWQYLSGCFDKKQDLDRMQKLPYSFSNQGKSFRDALLFQTHFGYDKSYQAPMMHIGQHIHYKNQSLWLRLDSELLQTTTSDSISETTHVTRKRAGEPPIILPPEKRFLNRLDPQRWELANENKRWLEKNPELFQLICDHHQQFQYPEVERIDVDAALYTIPFSTTQEDRLFQQFHTGNLEDKLKLIPRFMTEVRREQALRIIGRYNAEALTQSDRECFNAYLEETRCPTAPTQQVDYQNRPRLSVKHALEEIDLIRQARELDADQVRLLEELSDYLKGIS